MDGIDALRAQALTRRNAAVQAAKQEYHAALMEIAALARKLHLKQRGRPCKIGARDYTGLKAATVAMEILREGKAWSLVELTTEVQRRGCRAHDHPRAVANAVDGALRYYRKQLRRDEAGRPRFRLISDSFRRPRERMASSNMRQRFRKLAESPLRAPAICCRRVAE
jgi:hypothetical protein